jgi:predicted ATPase
MQEVHFGKGKIIYSLTDGKIKIDLKDFPEQLAIKEDNLVPSFIRELPISTKSSLVSLLPIIHPSMFRLFIDNAIYDFDPKLPKKATPITGKAELEEDGSNLAIVLNNILENEGKKRKLLNLMKDLLPFVDDINVEKFADKSILSKLKEKYYHKEYLPASLISDGTINITALIIALYFEQKPLSIIEEPERNIHPYLISKIVELMKDVASKKQVLVTTHNPQMVKFAGQENILLISRDKDGFSVISKPYEKEMVREFLKNELGIEDLYIQNLL